MRRKLAVVLLFMLAFALMTCPAAAVKPTPTPDPDLALWAAITDLQDDNAAILEQMEQLQAKVATLETTVAALQVENTALAARVEALESASECTSSPEQYDGLDNDCDGTVDEGTVADGTCGSVLSCLNRCGTDASCQLLCVEQGGLSAEIHMQLLTDCCGSLSSIADSSCFLDGGCSLQHDSCVGQGSCTPSAEQCDGTDNNCDGYTDEGDLCGAGECINGECTSSLSCSGISDCMNNCGGDTGCEADCFESADPGSRDIFNSLHSCAESNCMTETGYAECITQNCGEQYEACFGSSPCTVTNGGTETCDGIDNDCDSSVDEGYNVGASCTSEAEGCPSGVIVCSPEGTAECSVSGPVAEICDGIDNNCNGITDDGATCGVGETCSDAGVCVADSCVDEDNDGYSTCGGDCNDTDPAISPGLAETCDGRDNDCNGEIDDGYLCGGGICLNGGCTAALSCSGILECMNDCSSGDTECTGACYASGSQIAQGLIDSLNRCITGCTTADSSCFTEVCSGEYNACINGPEQPPEG